MNFEVRDIRELVHTINHFIEEVEADMEEVSSSISDSLEYQSLAQGEDVDFCKDRIEQLDSEWEDYRYHLYNLNSIKNILHNF